MSDIALTIVSQETQLTSKFTSELVKFLRKFADKYPEMIKKLVKNTVILGFGIGLTLITTNAFSREEPWNHYNNPLFMLQPGYEATLSKLPKKSPPLKYPAPYSSISWSLYRGGFAWRPRTNPMKPRMRDIEYKTYTREEVKALPKSERESLSPAELLSIINCDYTYQAVKNARSDPQTAKSMRQARATIVANEELPTSEQKSLSYDKLKHDWLWHGYCDAVTGSAMMFQEPKPVTVKNCDGLEITLNPEIQKAFLMMAYDRAANAMDETQLRTANLGLVMDPDYKDLKGKYCEDCGRHAADPQTVLDGAPLSEAQWQDLNRTLAKAQAAPEKIENKKYVKAERESDVNAGAFHLALAHQLGIKKEMIAMDRYPGDTVWNFPIVAYTSTEVPGKSRGKSAKAAPGTVKEVLMSTKVTYSVNDDGGYPSKPILKNRTYEYYLELDANGKILGGSWATTDHPDYLWHPATIGSEAAKEKMFSGEFSFMKSFAIPR